MLPSLTDFDRKTSSETTLDPLGHYLTADQLATKLLLAVPECTKRIRFLTVMAFRAIVNEILEVKAGDSGCGPWLAWTWLVVEQLALPPPTAPGPVSWRQNVRLERSSISMIKAI